MTVTKKCSKCLEEKPIEDFCKHRKMKDGYNSKCKECVKKYTESNRESIKKYKSEYYLANKEKFAKKERKNYLKRKYNVSIEWYDAQLEKQESKCMICGTTEGGGVSSILHVDHNHKTGQIRGLLCRSCNTGLGLFKENPFFLEKAIQYVNRFEQN